MRVRRYVLPPANGVGATRLRPARECGSVDRLAARRPTVIRVGRSHRVRYAIRILSSIFQCSATETTELAAISPLAATAGMPMPGKVESPQQKKPGQLVPCIGSIPSAGLRKGP